ncbi:MAG: SDR family NAD(P)-dependent oxidoreductase [Caldilineaceae bacterium]|nr:SDR family NAD(P)-dependent oxidoreductase [Caldilineaceae bacterium]
MPLDLARQTILITGASGYIGSGLAQRLVQEGATVRGLVRNPSRAEELAAAGVEIARGDVTDPASLAAALDGCTLVYHGAAWVGERGSRDAVWAVNVEGTRHLALAAQTAGVRRFVHLSSCAVYGSPQHVFEIDEGYPARARGDLYADSKVAAEEAVWAAGQAGLPVVVARPSQVYGLGSPQFTLRPLAAIQAGKLRLIDGGKHLCKPVYIDNLVDGLLLCATHDAALGEAWNLTDGAPVPWREFFGAYAAMVGVKLKSAPYALAYLAGLGNEVIAALQGRKPGLSRATVQALRSRNSYSNHKARARLGWVPGVDLAEGMRRTEVWLRENGYLPPAVGK